MDEDVFAALKPDKAKPFPVVEPFHGPLTSHTVLLS
jgi:hypothetical protein